MSTGNRIEGILMLNTSQFTAGINSAKTQIATLLAEANKLTGSLGGVTKSSGQFNQSLDKTRYSLQAGTGGLTQYQQKINEAQSAFGGLTNAQKAAGQQYLQSNQKIQQTSNVVDNARESMRQATNATQTFSNSLGMLKTIASSFLFVIGARVATDIMTVANTAINADNKIRTMGKGMGWTTAQTNKFIARSQELQSVYRKTDMNAVSMEVSKMARIYKLNNDEATNFIETSAVFTSAMAEEGRTARDSALALKDLIDQGQGWERRLSEIGVTKEALENAGWSGNKEDKKGIIAALQKVLDERQLSQMAKEITNLDDAFKVLTISGGQFLGSVLIPITPYIYQAVRGLSDLAYSVRDTIGWLMNSFNNLPDFAQTAIKIGLVTTALGGIGIAIGTKVIPAIIALKGAGNLNQMLGMVMGIDSTQVGLVGRLGLVAAGIGAITFSMYELGKAMGWWKDFNGMLSNTGAQIALLGSSVGLIAFSFKDVLFGMGKFAGLGGIFTGLKNKILGVAVANEVLNTSMAKTGIGGLGKSTKSSGILGSLSNIGKSAPNVAAGATGLSAISASISSMLVPLLSISAVVAIMIPIVAGLAIEALAFVRLIGEVIKALDFKSLKLDADIGGIKKIGEAMWELSRAFAALTLVNVVGIVNAVTGGFVTFVLSLKTFVKEVKSAVPIINELASMGDIDPSVAGKIRKFNEACNQVVSAVKSLASISAAQFSWNPLTNFVRAMEQARYDISRSSVILGGFKNIANIDPLVANKLKSVSGSLKSVADAISSLNTVSSKQFSWNPLTNFIKAMEQARLDIGVSSVILAGYSTLANIPDGTANKIKNVTSSLKNVADSIVALNTVSSKQFNWNPLTNFIKAMESARYDIGTASVILAGYSTLANIPEGVANKIQRVQWNISNVVNAIKSLNGFNSSLGNFNLSSLISKLQSARTGIGQASVSLASYNTLAVIDPMALTKVDAVKNAIFRVVQATTALNNVPSSNPNSGNIVTAVNNIKTAANELQKLTGLNLNGSISGVIQIIGSTIQQINTALRTANGIQESAHSLGAKIPAGIKSGLGNGGSLGISIVSQITTAINSRNSFMTSSGRRLGTSLTNGFRSSAIQLKNIAAAEVNWALNAINSRASSFWTAGARLGASFSGGYKSAMDINSPGIVARLTAGEVDYTLGFIQNAIPMAYSSASKLGQGIVSGFGSPNLVVGDTEGLNNVQSNAQAVMGLAQNTTDTTTSLFSGMDNTLLTTFVGLANTTRNTFSGINSSTNNQMKDMAVKTTSQIGNIKSSWYLMQDALIGSASNIRNRTAAHINKLQGNMASFWRKVRSPVLLLGGAAGGYAGSPSIPSVRPSNPIFRGYAGNPLADENITGDKGINLLTKDNPYPCFDSNCYAGWELQNWTPNIKNSVGKWNTNFGHVYDPFLNVGKFINSNFPVKGNPSVFKAFIMDAIGRTNYQFYYDSKGGSPASIYSSGSFNCFDGFRIVEGFANAFGLPCSMARGTWNGIPHVWANVGGVGPVDATAIQNRGSLFASNAVRAAGPAPRNYNTDNEKIVEKKIVKHYTVKVDLSGSTVYGVDDLNNKINNAAEEAALKLQDINPNTGE